MAMQALDRKHQEELEVYTVQLEVLSGHGLPSKDIGGASDPYVKVSIGDQTKETKVIKNNLNPEWNEKFEWKFFQNPKEIKFDVLDKDMTSDDFLGQVVFALDEQFNSSHPKPFVGHLKLSGKKGKDKDKKGTIKVKISAQRFLPISLEKQRMQNEEMIMKQNQEINHLSAQNEKTRKENDELRSYQRQQAKQLQQQQQQQQQHDTAQSQQPGGSQEHELRFPAAQKPTKRKEMLRKSEGFVMRCVCTLMSIWQFFLSKIYAFPHFGYYADLLVLFIGTLLRLEVAYTVLPGATSSKRPATKRLKLYEYEGSADCKMVRETLCALDLDCEIYPCPRPGADAYLSRYRGEVKQLGCTTLPVLVDENYSTPAVVTNPHAINAYLHAEFGNNVKMGKLDKIRWYVVNHWLAVAVYKYLYLGLLRNLPEQGNQRYPDTVKPNQPLELWSYEASPYCAKVREVLCSLEIAYVLRNVAPGSQEKRHQFDLKFAKKYPKWRQKMNLIWVPLLVDPNTEKEIMEPEEIKQYLLKTYRAPKSQ